jgi:hypothetical protein
LVTLAGAVVDAQAAPVPPREMDPVSFVTGRDGGWRRPELEVYRWPELPGFLILDTRDYATQQRMFHRLAFFVEKAGYVGRVADYDEIALLRGYNAHDYYNEDIVRFIEAAERQGIPLLPEETELMALLEVNGAFRRRVDRLEARRGGVLSVSRESGPSLRRLHLHHELTHGVFYADTAYAAACRSAWARLAPDTRQFYRLFLAWQQYDVSDAYLVVNEFQAWTLHNPERWTEDFFRKFAADQLSRDLPNDHPLYKRIVEMPGAPFREIHLSLRQAMALTSPAAAARLDALRALP